MSLKESHRAKMLIAEKHERDLILAEATAQMLLEALDSKDLADATKVLKKLNAIAKVSPPVLAAAIKEAADEVNEFTGGGLGALAKKATTWLAKKFGAKAGTNPILKALTLLNSLELGLSNAVDLINNNAPDYDGNSDKSLMDQVDETGAKNLRKNLAKAFQPGGVFAKIKSLFGSTGGIPYIKNVDKMVEEIMLMPAKKITALINAATAGESSEAAAEAAKDMATAGKQQGSGQAQTPKSNEPVKSIDDLASAVATGQTQDKGGDATAKAAEMAQENPKKVVKQLVDDIAKRSQQNADVVEKVLSVLVKKGKMKTEFKVTEESFTRSSSTRLTMRDVVDAQMALLKCGRSTQNWVNILFEIDALDEKTNKGGQKRKAKQAAAKAAQQPAQKQPAQTTDKPQQDTQQQKPEATQQSAEKPVEKSADQQSSEKSSNPVAKEVQDLLKDVDIKAIEAVLDAIPAYLKLEVARRRSRVI